MDVKKNKPGPKGPKTRYEINGWLVEVVQRDGFWEAKIEGYKSPRPIVQTKKGELLAWVNRLTAAL